jgi:hypothetical protein
VRIIARATMTIVAALSIMLPATATPVLASAPNSPTGGATLQCTRQYIVNVQTASIRSTPGGTEIGTAFSGYKLNRSGESPFWYFGNIYTSGSVFVTSGWILISSLTYSGVCF